MVVVVVLVVLVVVVGVVEVVVVVVVVLVVVVVGLTAKRGSGLQYSSIPAASLFMRASKQSTLWLPR